MKSMKSLVRLLLLFFFAVCRLAAGPVYEPLASFMAAPQSPSRGELLPVPGEEAVFGLSSRGGGVDQGALVAALEAGRPAVAALDVMDPEPPAANEPLLKLKNVLLAPHLGSATVETRTRMAMLAVDNLLAVLEGRRPAHVVNPEVL